MNRVFAYVVYFLRLLSDILINIDASKNILSMNFGTLSGINRNILIENMQWLLLFSLTKHLREFI